MVLSEAAVSKLCDAALREPASVEQRELAKQGWGVHDAVREIAGEAVRDAARGLKFDATRPPIPAFDDGESALVAAVRVLELKKAAKELELYRRRQAAAEKVGRHYAALERRQRELRAMELDRLRAEVAAGRDAALSSPALRDELDTIRRELDTLARPDQVEESVLPFRPADEVVGAALSEGEWLAAVLYMHLLHERLMKDADDDPRNPGLRAHAETVVWRARNYAMQANTRASESDVAADHDRAVRLIAAAVRRADLHGLRQREKTRQQQHERQLEQQHAAAAAAS